MKGVQPGGGVTGRAHHSDIVFSSQRMSTVPACPVNPLGMGEPTGELIRDFPSDLFKEVLSFANVIFLNVVQAAG